MPYSMDSENLPENVMEMDSEKKELWIDTFNGVMESCMKKHDNTEKCEGMAFATANNSVKGKEEKKSVDFNKGNDLIPYTSATTMADAMAQINTQEQMRELRQCLSMYEQVVNNIMYSQDITDKKSALASTAKEFQDYMTADMSGNTQKAVTKKENDGEHPASHYLVVEDENKPGTFHLRIKDVNGKLDHRLMGAAWAALHTGFRGNKYEGPQKKEALARLKKLYESEKLSLPSEKSIDLSDDEANDYFRNLIRYSSQDGTIKSLGNNRVGGYAVLWGNEKKKDLTGEFFDRETKDLDLIFKSVGKLPYLYHHGLDDRVKTRVIGVIDTLEFDDVGLWYEAQLKMADEYDTHVMRLIREGKLKSSSQTLASGRQVAKSGHIERWVIVEASATPTPAEPRMVGVEELKSMYQAISLDFDNVEKALEKKDGNGRGEQGDEKSRLQGWLQLEQDMLDVEMEFVI